MGKAGSCPVGYQIDDASFNLNSSRHLKYHRSDVTSQMPPFKCYISGSTLMASLFPLVPVGWCLHLGDPTQCSIVGEDLFESAEYACFRVLATQFDAQIVHQRPMLVRHRIARRFGECEQLLVVVLGREQHAYLVVVQGVDQCDESPGGRFVEVVELGYVSNDDRVKELTEREIVDGAQRPTAELIEIAVGHVAAGLLEDHVSAHYGQRSRPDDVVLFVGEDLEQLVQLLVGALRFEQVNRLLADVCALPVVDAGRELDDLAVRLEQRYERQEGRTLEAVLVEIWVGERLW